MNDELAFLAKRKDLQPDAAPAQIKMERDMLLVFYKAWEALHSIEGDKRNPEIRRKAEEAAQTLVDAAQPRRVHYGN